MPSTLRASVLDVPLFPISESVVKCCHGNITSCQTQTLRVMVLIHQTLNYDRHRLAHIAHILTPVGGFPMLTDIIGDCRCFTAYTPQSGECNTKIWWKEHEKAKYAGFIVLVSGPDCFSRVYVCVIFYRFMGPTCLQRTMAVMQVWYSDILHYSHNKVSEKYITLTVRTHQSAHK